MFRIAAMPDQQPIFSQLSSLTPYGAACRSVTSPLAGRAKIELQLVDIDVGLLLESVLDIVKTMGMSGWRHKDGESNLYGGFSLTYNPDHQDGLDPHVSTLGTPKNDAKQFFFAATSTHANLKNSYFDTYGFRTRTEASKFGYLGRFIDSFSRSMIRSRVGIVLGENVDPNDQSYKQNAGWHRDEPVFENMRVNIPLQTDDNYVFQMEADAPYHLEVGKAYTWDTNRPHRVFATGRSSVKRIHLVLGFAPWFDYHPATDAWAPNAYFGRMHPFDMAAQGHFSPHLRLAH